MANDANGDDVEILPTKQMLRPNPGKFVELIRKNEEWGRRDGQSRSESNLLWSRNISQRPERTL